MKRLPCASRCRGVPADRRHSVPALKPSVLCRDAVTLAGKLALRWVGAGLSLVLLSSFVWSASAAPALKTDEQVVFYPSLGWRAGEGWQAEIHGCVYEPESRPLTAAVIRRALGIDDDALSAEERRIFRERTRLFLVDNQRGKRVSVVLYGQIHTLAKSQASGHFMSTLSLPRTVGTTAAGSPPAQLRYRLSAGTDVGMETGGSVHLLETNGLSVISDIDDTIKLSRVLDRDELLRNTFCRPFKPVPGMAAAYQTWATNHGAAFHYVSASPWQLYAPLAEFAQSNGFPAGTFHLRPFRVKDGTFLDLFKSPERYKPGVIEPVLKRFPQRRFVLVGDSGERDPEIYAALARKYPAQIARILIRDVTGEAGDSPRYQRVFAVLPAGLWRVFKQPDEIGRLAL